MSAIRNTALASIGGYHRERHKAAATFADAVRLTSVECHRARGSDLNMTHPPPYVIPRVGCIGQERSAQFGLEV